MPLCLPGNIRLLLLLAERTLDKTACNRQAIGPCSPATQRQRVLHSRPLLATLRHLPGGLRAQTVLGRKYQTLMPHQKQGIDTPEPPWLQQADVAPRIRLDDGFRGDDLMSPPLPYSPSHRRDQTETTDRKVHKRAEEGVALGRYRCAQRYQARDDRSEVNKRTGNRQGKGPTTCNDRGCS